MDENKINPEMENEPETVTEETADVAAEEKQEESAEKTAEPKEKKPKKMRNRALLRRGSFSIVITAAVLAGIIVLNILTVALSKRVSLDFDMTPEKRHSLSQENIDYIKKVEKKVVITVCADEGTLAAGLAQAYEGYFASEPDDFFYQTETLLKKYPTYNDKIEIEYAGTQTSKFLKLWYQHMAEGLTFGSIVVSSGEGDKELSKVLNIDSIYQFSDDYSEITGNNIETELTKAIAYVTTGKERKVAILTGHSSSEDAYQLRQQYQYLLEESGYTVEVNGESTINEISNEYDAIAIIDPVVDFQEGEIDAISKYLENGGERNKSLLYFTSSLSGEPLPDFNNFLADWGITVNDGSLIDAEGSTPSLVEAPITKEHSDISDVDRPCMVIYGVPFSEGSEAAEPGVKTDVLARTGEGAIAYPLDAEGDFDSEQYPRQSYCVAIRSEIVDYNEKNEEVKSQVFAFNSSISFLYINFDQEIYQNTANQNLVRACNELALGGEVSNVYFPPKQLANISFTTDKDEKTIRWIFMGFVPILVIVTGVVVYIRRRNAR